MLLIIKDGCDWAFYLQNPTPVSFQINCAPIVGDLFLVDTSCLFLIQIKLMLLEFLTLLLDFLLTVKAVTLIIISGRDSAI